MYPEHSGGWFEGQDRGLRHSLRIGREKKGGGDFEEQRKEFSGCGPFGFRNLGSVGILSHMVQWVPSGREP